MDEDVRLNLLEVISQAIKAVQREDIRGLKDLSNMTVHTASIKQDQYSISIAVLIYALSKIYERSMYEQYKGWPDFSKEALRRLERAYEELDHGNDESFDETVKSYLELINGLEPKLREFIQDVIEKAKIAKGSRLYEHGISMGRTAALLGISQYELMDYTGKTYISDIRLKVLKPASERMRVARSLFT